MDENVQKCENKALTLYVKVAALSLSSKSIRHVTLVISAIVTCHGWYSQVGVTGSVLFNVSVWSDPAGHPRGRIPLHFTHQ